MTAQTLLTFGILAAAIVLFLSERVRADLVALWVVAALGLTGVLSPQQAFSGFGSPAVAIIVSIFVLAEGLRVTGLTDRVGALLLRLGGRGEGRLASAVMLSGAFLALFMNNTAAASLLLPAATSAGRWAGVSVSRLLMPLAFATILGGTATLLTTSNVVVSDILRERGYRGYGLLDFLAVGLPLVAVGVAYMAVLGVRLLPRHSPGEAERTGPQGDLLQVYRLGERLFRVRVEPGSSLDGKSLAACSFRELCGATVVAVERGGRVSLSPEPGEVLRGGDVLLLEGKQEELEQMDGEHCLLSLEAAAPPAEHLESSTVAVVEAVLSPRSALIGQTLAGAHFREKYGMTVLALWRAGKPTRTGLRDLELRFGDALLLQGPRERIPVLRSDPDLILLESGVAEPRRPEKAPLALLIMGATLLCLLLGWPSPALAVLAGALCMILARVLPADLAYQAIEWRVIFLMAGMLPISTAMVESGAAQLLAEGIVRGLGGAGPLAVAMGAFGLSALLVQTMSGVAVAAVVAPVAILAADTLGLDPRAMGMAVVLGSSMAFVTPLGHPVNLLVMGPGGYRFRDFLKVGLPLTLLLFAVVAALLPVVWPLRGAP
ncbi:MAG: SLC13 family permease [Deferrisomatales bacterium]|nr:SLC13 family permease [Deferrisomatales bacterium]